MMNNDFCAEANEILRGGIDWFPVSQVSSSKGEVHIRLRSIMRGILTPKLLAASEKRMRDMPPPGSSIISPPTTIANSSPNSPSTIRCA